MEKLKNILLVEDNTMVQFATRMVLQNFSCHVDVVETGEQTLELCRHNHYDLIFMDIGLPDTKGYIVAKELRKAKYEVRNTPIIALSAHADASIKKQCVDAGMDDYIIKPLTDDKIKELFNKYLE